MHLKEEPQYIKLVPDFKPLPKYGHLSEITPEFAAIRSAVDKAYEGIWGAADWAAFRGFVPQGDAAIPPGGPDRSKLVTEILHFPARDGHSVELKVYKSPNVVENATLVYRMHGGGWVIGNHETDGAENVYAAFNPNLIVISVDYRMAPDHPFPQPINDCYDGLQWCIKNAQSLGIDPAKIILAGSSAGANLAAALALIARDEGIKGILAQILNFPSVCHPKFFPKDKYEYGSFIQNWDTSVLDIARMEFFLDAHVPEPTPDSRHSPLLAKSFQGLPPAFIACGGLDVLRDEALAYGEALQEAGVNVEMHAFKGLPHCFPGTLFSLPETADFYKRYDAFIARYCDGG